MYCKLYISSMGLIYQYPKSYQIFCISSEMNIYQQQWVYHTRSSNYFIIWLNFSDMIYQPLLTGEMNFHSWCPSCFWGLLWDWLLICILLFSSLSYHCSIGLHRLFWYVGMACSIGTSVWLAVFHDVFITSHVGDVFVMLTALVWLS